MKILRHRSQIRREDHHPLPLDWTVAWIFNQVTFKKKKGMKENELKSQETEGIESD